jgi:hypothetical protein
VFHGLSVDLADWWAVMALQSSLVTGPAGRTSGCVPDQRNGFKAFQVVDPVDEAADSTPSRLHPQGAAQALFSRQCHAIVKHCIDSTSMQSKKAA